MTIARVACMHSNGLIRNTRLTKPQVPQYRQEKARGYTSAYSKLYEGTVVGMRVLETKFKSQNSSNLVDGVVLIQLSPVSMYTRRLRRGVDAQQGGKLKNKSTIEPAPL